MIKSLNQSICFDNPDQMIEEMEQRNEFLGWPDGFCPLGLCWRYSFCFPKA